jgi:hypothetical protein
MTATRISGLVTDCVLDRYDIGDESDLADAGAKIPARREISRTLVSATSDADK